MSTDPSADFAAEKQHLLASFFAELAEQLRHHDVDDPAALEAHIVRRHRQLLDHGSRYAVDQAAKHNLELTLVVLAGYQVLEPHLGAHTAYRIVRYCLIEPLSDTIQMGVRAMLDAAPDPFVAIVASSKEREANFFGGGFDFERAHDDADIYQVNVRRCFHHDVLSEHQAAHLTRILCDFDANWIQAIEPQRDHLIFQRPETIATGATHCPFRFQRTPPNARGPAALD